MGYIKVVTPPAAEPISTTLMLQILKQPPNSSDKTYVQGLIQAARETIEGWTGRSLVDKGYVQVLDSFPYFTDTMMSQNAYPPSYYSLPRYSTTLWNYSQLVKLLRSPLRQVSKIVYIDSETQQPATLLPALPNWLPTNEQFIGDEIEDSNGNVQIVTSVTEGDEDQTSITGTTAPSWSATIGVQTVDNMVTWTCAGPAPAAGFLVDAVTDPPRLFPLPGGFWPSVLYVPNAVSIYFTAGYGNDADGAPQSLVVALQQLVQDWYFNREPIAPGTVCELPNHIKALVALHRVWDLSATRG